VAQEEGAPSLVVMTRCTDPELHRARIEGRERGIPNWYELEWDHVERARGEWVSPDDVDLVLDAAASVSDNAEALRDALAGWGRSGD
jgi:hypothetical protein